MIILSFKRALEDFRNNRLLNIITLLTVSLAILIVSTFILFFINTSEIMSTWKKGLRMMVYLEPGFEASQLAALRSQIQSVSGVKDVRFISKEAALKRLKLQNDLAVQNHPGS